MPAATSGERYNTNDLLHLLEHLPIDANEALPKRSHAHLAICHPSPCYESTVDAVVDHLGALEVDLILPPVLVSVDDVLSQNVRQILRRILHLILRLGFFLCWCICTSHAAGLPQASRFVPLKSSLNQESLRFIEECACRARSGARAQFRAYCLTSIFTLDFREH